MKRTLVLLSCISLLIGLCEATVVGASEQFTASGKIVAVDKDGNTLKLKAAGDEPLVFEVSVRTAIRRDGVPVDLGTVKAGEQATISYEKGPKVHLAISVDLKKMPT